MQLIGVGRMGLLMLLAFGAAASVGRSQDDGPKTEPIVIEPPSPGHEHLQVLVGPWRVRGHHYLDDGTTIEVKAFEETEWILDKHAIRRVYTGEARTRGYKTVGTLTYNTAKKRYEGTWLDNLFTTGVTHVVGEWNDKTATMTFTITSTGKDGTSLEHTVVDRVVDEKTRIVTTFRVDGDAVKKIMEVKYILAPPCPSSGQLFRVDELSGG